MKKNRIVTRVKHSTGIIKSKNRNEDLIELRSKYTAFSKCLKFLITTLSNNHAAMLARSKARLEVAKAINSLTVDTPLFKCAGDIPANAVGTTDGGSEASLESGAVPHNANPSSYAAIHLQLHKKNKLYADKYTEHVITYAKDWANILDTRVAKHVKQADKLRVDLDHYGKKVDDLNRGMNKTMSKGKSAKDSSVDKVKRNEQKLIQARQEYDRFVNDLCGFMEEIMERGWKDLHPLLVKMAQFDGTLAHEEASLLKGNMTLVTEELKGMGTKYPNLKPAGRLDELKNWSLESLNKVNPSMRSESPLMIQSGLGEQASYVTGPGGMGSESPGGIHAGLGSDGGGGIFGREDSHASGLGADPNYGRTSDATSDSYDWASGGGGLGGSSNNLMASGSPMLTQRRDSYNRAPSSGGLPPLNPNMRSGSFNQDPRMNSDMSASSIATSNMLTTMQAAAPPPSLDDIFHSSAPAPMSSGGGMPPPPPNMPPPPPPQANISPQVSMNQLSLYDGPQSNPHSLGGPSPGAGGYGMSNMSSNVSAASGNTNPFEDNTFGAPPAPPGPPQSGSFGGTPQMGNPYGTPQQQYQQPPLQQQGYGGGQGGGGTNPFDF
eukprot:CAMPEP_0183707788 /NCGR_PEP_ID=MMETSP0737-20130205/4254_1 /TAXON_ID=385413 /ORGANISM="Thalassiosira miniscula, Strain CCMP1093" /LENGTH=605 /DNA_ID=CAMNT_0025935517 /DNA_START=149 /DNA_END=1966 /DNA_ORIENTATION=-